ncbi:AAA domain-containing protein [Sulfidibacter corallicola]|uniref:ORC1/DEAH AAA+ ATPase domain-containing protein n=1 Tax=Sulfidibacter corallicola TaxID=2818388 RepID=A0A8A4TM42_SULCO|nr:AAA family ATPase [Sulfidibacter corallicola]QTD49948.1 hypothetical protein J3U87_30570 [Sulfidibacter corallicola]
MTFIINRWVRGKDFMGREEHLDAIRTSGTKPIWILGNRRVGKTSLLRQVEWLCREELWPDHLALYWDLQGAGSVDGLKDSFLEALEDAEEVVDALGLDLDALEDLGFSEIMNRFRRRLKGSKDKRCMLLIDECEELVDVTPQEPGLLAVFRKLTHSSRNLAVIMAGSMRLYELDESQSRTSPFLPDFLPPRLLGPFSAEQSRALLTHHGLAAEVADRIHGLTLGNPHLLQLLGEQVDRLGDLELVIRELKQSKVCHYFYNSNFLCLPEEVRHWWRDGLASTRLASLQPDELNFAYARQSALLAEEGDSIRISPLLRILEGEELAAVSAEPVTSLPIAKQAPLRSPERATVRHPVFFLVEGLRRRQKPLTALSYQHLEEHDVDPDTMAAMQDPPSLELVDSLRDPSVKPHLVLDGASPEYIRQLEGDVRTHVYLIGSFLYRKYLGQGPFGDVEDIWARAGKLESEDVVVPADSIGQLPDRRLGMVLLRCLKADPEGRYGSLEALERDLNDLL